MIEMRKIKLFLLLLVLVNITGCIEITEEITVNADQSGKVSFSLNLGSLGSFAKLLGNYLEGTSLDQLKELPEKGAALLKDVTGVSNILTKDNDNFIELSFNFKNSKTLNSALYKLFNKKKSCLDPGYLTIKKHKLIRKNYGTLLRLYVKKYASKLKDKSYLKMIKYNTVFNFPQDVKTVSNPLSKISADKKSVAFSCTIDELLTTPINIGNKIKY